MLCYVEGFCQTYNFFMLSKSVLKLKSQLLKIFSESYQTQKKKKLKKIRAVYIKKVSQKWALNLMLWSFKIECLN